MSERVNERERAWTELERVHFIEEPLEFLVNVLLVEPFHGIHHFAVIPLHGIVFVAEQILNRDHFPFLTPLDGLKVVQQTVSAHGDAHDADDDPDDGHNVLWVPDREILDDPGRGVPDHLVLVLQL